MTTPNITADQIVISVQNVHAANPRFAAVLEKMDDKSGEELCKLLTSVFVNHFGALDRVEYSVGYKHAMFDIAPFDADELAIAIVDDLVANGADVGAAARIRETCVVL